MADGVEPYPYQVALSQREVASGILRVPTGAGKTAAAVLWWLWRLRTDRQNTPRRLVYCLPMRTLVEQTRRSIDSWVANLNLRDEVGVYTLMGGEIEVEWEEKPEQAAVLVGTQDQLLSRALNRGYAMSRYRWPVHFGLLNNDCLWIVDEVQLMGAGLPTTLQLAAFRERFGVFGKCATLWMSATLDRKQFQTVDFQDGGEALPLMEVTDADRSTASLRQRLEAVKAVNAAPAACRTPRGLAQFIAEQHQAGTQTLVVVNRVDRAREVFDALERHWNGEGPELLLLHSRFRPAERAGWADALSTEFGETGRVVVSTQIVEAGVDLSSRLLITELAPYPNMVQRFGRCNRAGELAAAEVYWVDRPLTNKQEKLDTPDELVDERSRREVAAPYEWDEFEGARRVLLELRSASPSALPESTAARARDHVLRRSDLLDLFDTSRDLSGLDVDISRFVRGGDEHDVLIGWRHFPEEPGRTTAKAIRDELCPVPLHEARAYVQRKARVWTWDSVDGEWIKVGREGADELLRPGMILLADAGSGGYDERRGWDVSLTKDVSPIAAPEGNEEGMADDPDSYRQYRQSLEAHSREVYEQAKRLMAELDGTGIGTYGNEVLTAAFWHDAGKAHAVFQATVAEAGGPLLAKSTRVGKHRRQYFRHELASALALLQTGHADLVVYLVASHHGKIRCALRSMPDEIPAEGGRLFARGIWEGDEIPPLVLDGRMLPGVRLCLTPMLLGADEVGNASWVERCLRLRDSVGPFRLAYLEAIVRAADWTASKQPQEVLP
jgi:CRISPR-associated endonuclease/helicase Cas3